MRWLMIPLAILLSYVLFYPHTRSVPLGDFAQATPAVKAEILRTKGSALGREILDAALRDPDADVRLLAVELLRAERYQRDAWTQEQLFVALKDPHAGVRREAGRSLWYVTPVPVRHILELLEDDNPRLRAAAAIALISVPPKSGLALSADAAAQALPLLNQMLKDDEELVRQSAREALERLEYVQR